MKPEQPNSSETKIDPRWKWHNRELMRLKGLILGKLEERQRAMNASLAESHKDPADTAADEDVGLHRIRIGNYGICEASGKPIAPDRLRAIPWTRFCKEAAPPRAGPRMV